MGSSSGAEASLAQDAVVSATRRPSQRRKQQEFPGEELGVVERSASGMLHEFKRLGKAREAELKFCLNRLASLSVLPGGYVRHSEKVIDLTEEIMLIVRGGRSSVGENARRMLKWSPEFSPAWRNVDCLTLPQVLQIFAAGVDEKTLIDVGSKQITLKQYALMDRVVFFELFMRSIDEIRQHLPAALGNAPLSDSERDKIAVTASTAAIHGCAVHICTACTGLLHWVKAKPSEATLEEVAFAWKKLQVSPERCAEIRRVWQHATAAATPVVQQQNRLEAELRELLAVHDSDSNDSFKEIVTLVKRLIHCYEKQRGILASADMHIFYSILTPFEFGVLAAIQLPRASVQQFCSSPTRLWTEGLRPGCEEQLSDCSSSVRLASPRRPDLVSNSGR